MFFKNQLPSGTRDPPDVSRPLISVTLVIVYLDQFFIKRYCIKTSDGLNEYLNASKTKLIQDY